MADCLFAKRIDDGPLEYIVLANGNNNQTTPTVAHSRFDFSISTRFLFVLHSVGFIVSNVFYYSTSNGAEGSTGLRFLRSTINILTYIYIYLDLNHILCSRDSWICRFYFIFTHTDLIDRFGFTSIT